MKKGRDRAGWGKAHLNLLVLEDSVDAAVEGRPREHGCDWVREVQYRLQHRGHALRQGVSWAETGTTQGPNKWSLRRLTA